MIAVTHLKSAKGLKLIVEVFTDSIDHEEVNRSVWYPAAAGACFDRQGGAFEDSLEALVHVEIVYRGGQINRDFSVSFFLVPYHRQFKRYRADFLNVHSCVPEVTFHSI